MQQQREITVIDLFNSLSRQIMQCTTQMQRTAGYLARREMENILEPLRADPRRLEPYGCKVYSQNDEDGILEEIFRRLGVERGRFCEIGVENGLECNSLYLLHKGWSGVWIEGNIRQREAIQNTFQSLLENGRLRTVFDFVTAENINALLKTALTPDGEPDFLSIDVDGNDIYLLDSLECRPKVVCVEYNGKFPPTVSRQQVYNPRHVWRGTDYSGSSLAALNEVARNKGYRLVGTCISGVNAFFLREDLFTATREKWPDSDPVSLYNPPRYWLFLDHFCRVGHPADFGPYLDLSESLNLSMEGKN